MDIIKKLQLAVDFGGEQFQVGQGEWEAMTFNDKHHWVFPLVRTACAYTKLGEYFRKMQKHQMEVLQTQGDFSETQEVRKVSKSKQNRERNRMEKFTNIISDLKNLIQNSLTRAVRMISKPAEVSEKRKIERSRKIISMGGSGNSISERERRFGE